VIDEAPLYVFDGTDWNIFSGGGGGSGDVVGPSSATDGHAALFDGTTGKLLKDGTLPSSSALPPTRRITHDACPTAWLVEDEMSNRLILPRNCWRGANALYVARKLGLTDNLQLALDAGDTGSYSGSGQSWLDLSGNGYDFFRGATSSSEASDPTFNGTAGNLSSSEFWSFDGGDEFTYDSANETWMQNLHKAGAKYAVLTWVFVPASVGATQGVFGTNRGAQTVGTGVHLAMGSGGPGSRQYFIRSINAGRPALDFNSGSNIYSLSAWQLVGVSLDEAAGVGGSYLVNNATFTSFTGTYGSPSSGNASQTMQIGARGNASAPFASGMEMAMFCMWSTNLTQSQVVAFFNATRARFGV
jgi:hypothetical protein